MSTVSTRSTLMRQNADSHPKNPITCFSEDFLSHALTPRNVGVMSDPDGFGSPKGSCGDQVEIGLKISDGLINEALFLTDGCIHTVACASVVTNLAKGRTITEALSLQPEEVMAVLGGLPPDHVHCARLAVSTLRLAVKNYLKNKDAPWKKLYQTSR